VTTAETRSELILAAEGLFADQGIDGPSLRELTRAAGQRNTGALQYHFGDRDGLLKAVLARHGGDIDRRRDTLLEHVEMHNPPNLAELSEALVLPAASKLHDPDGGLAYLQIIGEALARPTRFAGVLGPTLKAPGLIRWAKAVGHLLPPAAVGPPLHRRFAAIRFTHGELAGRARERSHRDHRLFTSQLVDLVAGLLTAPVTPTTERLIRRPSTELATVGKRASRG
jgi:AcrR family transcriptional regulator